MIARTVIASKNLITEKRNGLAFVIPHLAKRAPALQRRTKRGIGLTARKREI
jgi:hypothetical protein